MLKRGGSAAEFSAFEAEIAQHLLVIQAKRAEGVAVLRAGLTASYAAIAEADEGPELHFKASVEVDTVAAVRELLASQRRRDQLLGSTQRGPHRDDFTLSLSVGGAKEYASDGQQRGLCVALRIAQAVIYQQRLGLNPVLLADDVLGELDPQRKAGFLASLSAGAADYRQWYRLAGCRRGLVGLDRGGRALRPGLGELELFDQVELAPGCAIGPQADKAMGAVVVVGPQKGAVCFRDLQGLDRLAAEEGKAALVDRWRQCCQAALTIEQEHQPMSGALVAFLGDVAKAVQVMVVQLQANLPHDLASGALVGRFAGVHVQLAADGAPASEVGALRR